MEIFLLILMCILAVFIFITVNKLDKVTKLLSPVFEYIKQISEGNNNGI